MPQRCPYCKRPTNSTAVSANLRTRGTRARGGTGGGNEHLREVLFGQGELGTHDAGHLLPLLEVDLVVLVRVALVKDLEQVVDEPGLDLPECVKTKHTQNTKKIKEKRGSI